MPNAKLFILLALALIAACSSQGIKIYDVNYKGNHPEGAFKAAIGNNTIFTNGPDVVEVRIKTKPDFFCYAVNKEVLCKFNINAKINNDAAERYRRITQDLRENLLKSGKTSSILPERFVYYANGEKAEEVLFVNNLQNKSVNILPIAVYGKGNTEKEAQKNAVKKSEEITKVLIDKK
ncbi:hypothetical protein HYT92_02800 [Candidatus Pacearchaeota archaeon]|nr:hypothetical protein [Candidatus Pacearchaeota archaeon]